MKFSPGHKIENKRACRAKKIIRVVTILILIMSLGQIFSLHCARFWKGGSVLSKSATTT